MSATDTYIVYETTNLVNGKFYIGKCKIDLIKNYLGSGTILKKAIKKYGCNNFTRETLKEFNNEKDAYDYEELVVDKMMIKNPHCYNLRVGGLGTSTGTPLSIIHKTRIGLSLKGKKRSPISKKRYSLSKIGNLNPNSKKWFINGKIFFSSFEAGEYMNVSNTTVINWCKNNIPLCYSI